jgi:hypothetical protein
VYAPNSPKELAVCYVIEDAKEKGLWHLQIRGRSTPNSPAMNEQGKWSSPRGTVLTARKQAYSKDPHISISSGVSKAHHQRMSEHYTGKLRKDPAGKKTHIWDAGNSPDTKEGDSKWVKDKLPSGEMVSRPLRKELMCIKQSSKSNRDTKRRLVVLVPYENAVPTPASRADRKAGRGELRLNDLYKTVGRDKMNSTHILDSILPADDVDGADTSSNTGAANPAPEGQDGSKLKTRNGKKDGKKKKKTKEKGDEETTAPSSELLSFFDIGGVLVPIQKSSVNFQLGLYPGGDLVCQLSKRPTVRQTTIQLLQTSRASIFCATCRECAVARGRGVNLLLLLRILTCIFAERGPRDCISAGVHGTAYRLYGILRCAVTINPQVTVTVGFVNTRCEPACSSPR